VVPVAGKTDGVLGKWCLKERRYGRHFNAIMFRRTTVSAEDAIERSREIYTPMGGKFNEAKLRWRMPNGGRVSFGYLENMADANQWQGRNVTDVWIEEAGQYENPGPIDRLFGVLRSAHGVPIQMILTANPGGAGQHWIRARYQLSPLPRQPKVVERILPNGTRHQMAVIPARIGDNQILLRGDPGYIDRLHLVGTEQLVKAWLDGDWTAVDGVFFECWSERLHVLRPVTLPTTGYACAAPTGARRRRSRSAGLPSCRMIGSTPMVSPCRAVPSSCIASGTAARTPVRAAWPGSS
jgi:Phage terminase large subunit